MKKLGLKIGRFFRYWAAWATVMGSKEIGGVLYDYANGRWEHLHTWNDKATREQLDHLFENLATHMRDNIYVAMVKRQGPHGVCGVFQVVYPVQQQVRGTLCVTHMNKPKLWERCFCDLYPYEEAAIDTFVKCVQLAEKLGYRTPETI